MDFRRGAAYMLDDLVVRNRLHLDGILKQTVKKLASATRCSTIEPECEFIKIGVEVLTTDRPLMRSEQPAF